MVREQLPISYFQAGIYSEQTSIRARLSIYADSCIQETADTYILTSPVGPDTPINTIGDVKANLGKFIRATLERPDLTLPGHVVSAVIGPTSTGGLLKDWSKATGKSAIYLQVSAEAYEQLWGGFGVVEGANLRYFEEYGEGSWGSSEDIILTAQDLGLGEENFVGVEEFVRSAQS